MSPSHPLAPHGLRVLALFAAIAAASCSDPSLPRADFGSVQGQTRGDAGTCTKPEEGCACVPGGAPIDCFLEPRRIGDRIACSAGTRYCRDGLYTACLALREYTLPASRLSALVEAPHECNACDPACQTSSVVPEPGDLTPAHASHVVYDPSAGGITVELPPGLYGMPDADGDGVPDVADACPADPSLFRAPCTAGTTQGFFHVLPYGAAPVDDRLSVSIRLKTADVYLLIDNTGSMGGEIANLQASLTSGTIDGSCAAGVEGGVLGAIRCAIPDSAFGVGFFREYGDGHYGDGRNVAFAHVLDITDSLPDALLAVNRLSVLGNSDVPEAITQGLYAAVTGHGLGRYVANRTGCSTTGAWGYPCFRPNTIPIVITITDAMYHEGPIARYDYDEGRVGWPSALMPPEDRRGTAGDILSAETQATAMDLGDLAHAYRSLTGSTTGMQDDYRNLTPSRNCRGENAGDAVFRFTLSQRTELVVDTVGSSFDTSLGLRDASFQPIDGACNDDALPSLGYSQASMVVRTLDAGTYYVIVDGTGEGGSYRLNLRAMDSRWVPTSGQDGETALSAIQLGSLARGAPITISGSVTPYDDDFDPWCGLETQPDVFYEVSVASAGTLVVDTRGANFDTVVALLDASSRQLACNDDSSLAGDGHTSRLVARVAAGTYRIVVEGRGDHTAPSVGEFELHATLVDDASTVSSSPSGSDRTDPAPVAHASVLAALAATKTRVLGISSCDPTDFAYRCSDVVGAAQSVARASGAVDSLGNPLVYSIAPDGTGLGDTVVKAVSDLANYTRIDVTAVALDDPATPFDERLLVNGILLRPAGSSRCESCNGDECSNCLPGTTMSVEIELQNDEVMPSSAPQVFEIPVVVYADGSEIARTPIRVVVPPTVPTYPTNGSFWVDYDSSLRCAIPPQRPKWGQLTYVIPSPMPAGTSIVFDFRFADSLDALASVEPALSVTVSPDTPLSGGTTGTGTIDLATLLEEAGVNGYSIDLRLTASLRASSAGTAAPVLRSWDLTFECVDYE
ncbi:MAG: pre-peptidase C-terminal domain-containing protein [Polyangiales bacterium]